MLHPSIARIASVVRALDELSQDVVFIGGALAPLLQTNPPISRARPTTDVDAVVASTSYASFTELENKLRAKGFRQEIADQSHAHRWRTPDGVLLDLVPIGSHLGATGGEWDAFAVETAVETEITPGVHIKHARSIGFLALKWAAFWDRGVQNPFMSEDLEDILALLVSRDNIIEEIFEAPAKAIDYITSGLRWLRNSEDYEDLVAAHLANAMSFREVAALLDDRIIKLTDNR